MPNTEQQRLLGILKHGIETGSTADAGGIVRSPVSDFTCPELLAQEQRVFFRDTPLFMGLSSDLSKAGSYWADSETGLPILMTRDDDGRYRAFANVCRHRGTQVVADGRGERARFSCPYHAWTYGNTGELLAVNRESSFGVVDKASRGLVELPSAEYAGMLWVKPSPGGEIDVAQQLGGLVDDMTHWDLPQHTYGSSQLIRANINWKLAVDTFGDYWVAASVQANAASGVQSHIIFGRNEPGLHHYHNAHRRGLNRPLLKLERA